MADPARPAAPSTEDIGGVFRALATDRALVSALVANVVVLGFALHSGLPASHLITVYFLQSLTFGIFHALRIVLLKEYASGSTRRAETWSTAEARARGWDVGAQASERRSEAAGFLVIWLIAHAPLMGPHLFILGTDSALEAQTIAAYLVPFVLQQVFVLVLDLRRDRVEVPRVDVLRWLPFARFAPLLVVMFASMAFGAGAGILMVLAALKTIGDGIVQMVEARTIRNPPEG